LLRGRSENTSNRTVCTLRLKVRQLRQRRVSVAYVAGNRQGLKALHCAIGRLLASRTLEILEGPGYTVIYDRRQ